MEVDPAKERLNLEEKEEKVGAFVDQASKRPKLKEEEKVGRGVAVLDPEEIGRMIYEMYTPSEKYYDKVVRESMGYDLPSPGENFDPFDFEIMGGIGRCSERSITDDSSEVNIAAKFALAEINALENSKFEFVKIVKANMQVVSGVFYYITYEVRDPENDEIKTYQSKVFLSFDLTEKELWHHRLAPVDAAKVTSGN